jgi:hypothetical protein
LGADVNKVLDVGIEAAAVGLGGEHKHLKKVISRNLTQWTTISNGTAKGAAWCCKSNTP